MANRPFLRAAGFLAPLVLLPALLFALSGSDERYRYPTPPREIRKLVIETPQWEGIRYEIEEAFRQWLFERDGVGVEISWLEHGGGTKSLRWIEQSFGLDTKQKGSTASKDSIGVDILFGGGTDPYEELKNYGLLERYDPSAEWMTPERIPPELGGFRLYDPDHRWFGTCVTGFGIIVNHRVLDDLPERFQGVKIRDWRDLADPRLTGWVGAADPRSSSSYHTCFEIILQQKAGFMAGMRLLQEIGGNVTGYTKFSADVPWLCSVGQCAVAPTIDQYALAKIETVDRHPDPLNQHALEFVLPEGNTLVNADAVGILKGAPNLATARRFIDFLLSEEAAYVWMLKVGESIGDHRGPKRSGLNRATILPGVFEVIERTKPDATRVRQNPFRMKFDFHYDYPLAQQRRHLVDDLLGAFLIDTRVELAAAIATWRAATGERKGELESVLFALPFTEDEMPRIIADYKDPNKRERMRGEWTAYARARYRLVAEQGRAESVR